MESIRTKIIEGAAQLFSKKGYLTTSVQDIVQFCQISKGSFYNYFKSKEELAFLILKKKNAKRWESIWELEEIEGWSKEKLFIEQLKVQLQYVIDNKELFHLAFQSSHESDESKAFLSKLQIQDIEWLSSKVVQVYGDAVEPYAFDCAVMLLGLILSYSLRIFMIKQETIDINTMINFVIRRMNGIVKSFDINETPIFNKDLLNDFLQIERQERLYLYKQVKASINKMRKALKSMKKSKKTLEPLFACLDDLENEFSNCETEPRSYIVEGLLLYLQRQQIHELEQELHNLLSFVQTKL
ncbi:transcriptional regulator, TetR family [Seinonella peptonophila]|uniref:Transcriptional regulator, TetR family n=1 Tax=Seinonella peptonophila TaxID=112248 RepID=A0A1M4SR77_9BACL|nr:TetR/AcrR family transcriptional regulator [Seinonella peptonophila]SHE34675.1 transcriptional regulator, TetR family [Seinonella peptonophila]